MSETSLPAPLAERLRGLALVARKRFRGAGPGERPTGAPGGRTEFSGHHPYGEGEDFRDIDWNLYARHDQLHVREFRREEGVPVRIVVDASASMTWFDPSKLDFARAVATGLGLVALGRHHPVEVARATGGAVDEVRRFAGPRAPTELAAHLARFAPGGPQSFGEAVRAARRRFGRGALSYWITDGYGAEDARREVATLPRADDPVLLLVSSPEEVDPPFDGNLRLVDVEGSGGDAGALEVAIGPAEREAYRAAFARFVEDWRRTCLTSGVRFAWLRSDQSIEEVFFRVLTRSRIVA